MGRTAACTRSVHRPPGRREGVRIDFGIFFVSLGLKSALEITRSGLGADQLRGVIKYHKGTITVESEV